MRVDHLLIQTADLDETLHLYRDVMGMREVEQYEITMADGSVVDHRVLAAPGDPFSIVIAMSKNPVGQYAKQVERDGPRVHHIAYAVDDLDAAIADMKSKGMEFLSDEPIEDGQLRQIFSKQHPQTGIFHEFIQRLGGYRGLAPANITRLAEASVQASKKQGA